MKISLICAGLIAVFAFLWVFHHTDPRQVAAAGVPEDPDRQELIGEGYTGNQPIFPAWC